jgi:SanA protein
MVKRTLGSLIIRVIGILLVLLVVLLISIPPVLYFYYRQFVYVSVEAVGNNPTTAMVLGAAVYPNDTPSSALQERLDMAVTLYKLGKINRILVSGARDTGTYDEARAMKATLVEDGVPSEIIIEDNMGLRTFESCKRAKSEFKLESLLVVSQGFHLPRALYLCRSVGIQSYGIYAIGKFSSYHSDWYTFREIGAMYIAIWDILRYSN